jgi:hypothetical protein
MLGKYNKGRTSYNKDLEPKGTFNITVILRVKYLPCAPFKYRATPSTAIA